MSSRILSWLWCNCGSRKLVAVAWLATLLYIWTFTSTGRFVNKRELRTIGGTSLSKYQAYKSHIVTGDKLRQMYNDSQSKDIQSAFVKNEQVVYNVDRIDNKQSNRESSKPQYNKQSNIKSSKSQYNKQSNKKSSKPQYNKQDTIDHLLDDSVTTDPRTDIAEDISLSLVYQNKWVGFPDVDGPNCSQALYASTNNSLFPAKVKRINNEVFLSDSKDCAYFGINYGFHRYPEVTVEEQNFPIAFIILFHSNLDQVMFLLRAIYRPHNLYCLTVDANTGDEFIKTVRAVAQCFPNVFVSSKLEKIVYAGFTRLMADINCMADLLSRSEPWKYVINMPGQQFPLRTNLELVKILKMLNGSNDVEVTEERMTCVKNRHLFKHIYAVNNNTGKIGPVKTEERNPPPPYGLKIVKGSTYGTFSRAFIRFAVHHPIAKDFLEWNKYVMSPDEYFWSTLHHTGVLQVPGGVRETGKASSYLTSFSVWNGNNQTCATRFVRKICIFSPQDLANIATKNSLFANKFYITYHPGALHCLDQWMVNRTFAASVIDLKVYEEKDQ